MAWSYAGEPTGPAGGTTTMTDARGDVTVYGYQNLELIRAGDMNPRPQMTLSKETAASVLLDADRAPGPVAMARAAELAIGRAKEMGVGLCLVRATTHTAALGYYTHLAADAGMASIAISGSWALKSPIRVSIRQSAPFIAAK